MTRATTRIPLAFVLWAYAASGVHPPAPTPAPLLPPPPPPQLRDATVTLPAPAPAAVLPKRKKPAADPLYADIVEQAAQRYGVSAPLIHAVIAIESAYRSDAVSKKGAVGLMQLMPATAEQYGATDLRDPVENIHVGTRHLRELLEAFNHDVSLALAAYNAGAGAVKRHGGIPPYPETTRYVMKVLERYRRQRGERELARQGE